MNKILKRLKKWVSGLTAVIMVASLLPVQTALANVAQITVDLSSTPDNSPIVSGTTAQDGDITIFVDGQPGVPAVSVLGSDGLYHWSAQLGSVTPLAPGAYIVSAELDVDADTISDFEATNTLTVLPLVVNSMELEFTKDFNPAESISGSLEDGYVLSLDGNSATNYLIGSGRITTNEAVASELFGYELLMSNSSTPPTHFGLMNSNELWDGSTTTAGVDVIGPIYTGDTTEGVYSVKTKLKDLDGFEVDFEFEFTFNNPDTPTITDNNAVMATPFLDNSTKPTVDFGVDVDVDVSYEGGCGGDISTASGANNVVEFNASVDGVYEGCKVIVTDKAGDTDELDVTKYVVDKIGPTVDAGPDVLANKKTKINAAAENAGTGISKYEWTQASGPGVVVFSDATIEDPYVTADIEGVYELQLEVTDDTGLLRTAKDSMKLTWDANVSDVKDLTIEIDRGVANLKWSPSSDVDIDRIVIYRSEAEGELGDVLIMLTPHTVSYEDTGLLEDTVYYYTVVQVDDAGNESEGVVVSGKWVEKYVSSAPVVTSEEPEEDQEIKSGVTDNEEESEESGNTEIPTFGIVVLFLLIALGVYLLYLQNPELFKRMAFWKRKS